MAIITNVCRRRGTYYFRARVPVHLRAVVGRKELWRSLRTARPEDARRRGLVVGRLTERLWRDVERAMLTTAPVDKGAIKALIDAWLRAEIEEDTYLRDAPDGEKHVAVILRREPAHSPDSIVRYLDHDALEAFSSARPDEQRAMLGPDGYLLEGVTDLELARAGQRKVLDGADARHAAEDESIAAELVRQVFSRRGVPVDEFSPAFELATRLMIRAQYDLLRIVGLRDDAKWRPLLDDDPAQDLLAKLNLSAAVTPAPDEPASELTGETFSWAVREYLAEVRREGLSEGRTGEFEAAFRLFGNWMESDKLLREITPALAGDYRLALSTMPSGASTRPEYRLLSVRECIARARERGEERLLSPTTIGGNYINPLRSLFEWARATGKITENPFANIRAPKVRTSVAKRERAVFTSQQLNALFSQPLFTGAKGARGKPLYQPGELRISDWRFWVPLIAMFSGARLNEICGLRIRDFEAEGGVRFFHVRPDAPDKSVKTEAGVRRVPIHASLVELGLLDHVEHLRAEGSERLFPDLRPGARGYLSDIPSKFFADLIDRALGKDAPVVFHSFRHTFITRLRAARVEPLLRMAIVGHDPGETHESYGDQDIVALDAEVQKVVYPGLELSALRR